MTLLDPLGRSVDTLARAKALASWLHDAKIGRAVRQHSLVNIPVTGLTLAKYLRPSVSADEIGRLEKRIELAFKEITSRRVLRRLIAADLARHGEDRSEAMKALREVQD